MPISFSSFASTFEDIDSQITKNPPIFRLQKSIFNMQDPKKNSLSMWLLVTWLSLGVLPEKVLRRFQESIIASESVENILIRWSNLGLNYAGVKMRGFVLIRPKDQFLFEVSMSSLMENNALLMLMLIADPFSLRKHAVKWHVDFHLSVDGLAFRYHVPRQSNLIQRGRVSEELTEFRVRESGDAFLQEYHAASNYSPSYEGWYEKKKVGEKDAGNPSWWKRALNQ